MLLHKKASCTDQLFMTKESDITHEVIEKQTSPAFSSNGVQLQFADKDLAQESYGM